MILSQDFPQCEGGGHSRVFDLCFCQESGLEMTFFMKLSGCYGNIPIAMAFAYIEKKELTETIKQHCDRSLTAGDHGQYFFILFLRKETLRCS